VLQRARTDIKKPIEKMEVYRADHTRVKSGNPEKQGDPLISFEVCKQNARSMIILGTMKHRARYYHGASVLARKT
jgi:hypothetical protein